MRDAALRDGDGSVSNFHVAGNADLSGENHVVAYIGRSRQANLRDEQRVVAYAATVADLHQVVDLRAASNAGFANAGAVNAGVGLNLNIAFDDHVARLIRPLLAYFKGEQEFDGIGLSTTVHLAARPATSTSEAVEFFFPLSSLHCYEKYDCTGQQLIDAGTVLIDDERVSLDLQIAEGSASNR